MNRRTFIRISGLGTAIALTPVLNGCKQSKWTATLSMPQTLGRFCSNEELIEIGKTYSLLFEYEADESILEQKLLAEHQPQSHESLIEYIRKKIEKEFADSNLVIVKGWVLSRTEARQAALYSRIHA